MRYILFTKETCPFCVKAINMLEEKELQYDIVKFNDSDDQLELLEQIRVAYDWKTVPMVFCREDNQIQFIGGCDDLTAHLEKE